MVLQKGGKRHLAFMGLFVLFVSWSALFCLVIAYICIFQFSLVGRVCTNVERMDVACIMNEVKIYPNECSLLSKHYPRTTTLRMFMRRKQSHLLPQPIAPNLIPIDFLPRNRQLTSQALESTLTQLSERIIQLLLILLLNFCNCLDHLSRGDLHRPNRVRGQQTHIPIFIVVDVDFYLATQLAGRRVKRVHAAPAPVPVV